MRFFFFSVYIEHNIRDERETDGKIGSPAKYKYTIYKKGFNTRNAHMVHIVNLIRLKMVYLTY